MKHTTMPANMLLYIGLIALSIGVTIIAVPEFTFKAVVLSLGVIIGLSGFTTLIMRLKQRSENKFIQVLSIIGSSLIVLFGVAIAVYPTTFIEVFIIILGITIIIGGITQLVYSLSYTPISYTAKVFLAFSILLIIAGTIMVINPFKAIEDMTVFFGAIMAAFGLLNVILSFWIRSEIANLKNHIKDSKRTVIEIEAQDIEVEE